VVRLPIETKEGRNQLIEELDKICPMENEIYRILFSDHNIRRAPRTFGKLKFKGSANEKSMATLLLGNSKQTITGLNFCATKMEDYFKSCVGVHILNWMNLNQLQQEAIQKVFGDPETLSETEQDILNHIKDIDAALLNLKKGLPIEPTFDACWKQAGRAKQDRKELGEIPSLEKWRERSLKTLNIVEGDRLKKQKELKDLRDDPIRWLDPLVWIELLDNFNSRSEEILKHPIPARHFF